ncbi:heat shock factor protein 5 isoform X2 [Brienomyrus brachyistius]|uniref:heat shock factor protein 5 isoform X2 n=1 Tax=Brienomyrus brachyistius TaxID=42636 RepID=UPI0020B3231B|nr:heat shock factor protein 5 isoform X2 [Brienomyrus brachyistius]
MIRTAGEESTNREYSLHTILINPQGFPAKLWQLVNEPRVHSVRWDWFGHGVFIDQRRFEAELLSPIGGAFKSSSFSSFNRQLNLYGFRKVMPMHSQVGVLHHHFFNPDFRQGHPELLVNLKRLTSTNKARIQAGLEVPRRLPRALGRRKNSTEVTAGYRVAGHIQQGTQMGAMPPRQPPQSGEHLLMGYDCTPNPQCGWMVRPSEETGISFPVIYQAPSLQYNFSCAVPSAPDTAHVQPGALAMPAAASQYNDLLPALYHPACYAPAMSDGFFKSPMTTDSTGCVPQSTPLPHYCYYQTNYPPGLLHLCSQDQQSNENETVSRDIVCQTVTELQASPKLHMVKVETPENLIQLTCPSEVVQFPNSNLPASGQLSPHKLLSLSTSPLVVDSACMSPCGSSPLVGNKTSVPVSITADAAIGVPSL